MSNGRMPTPVALPETRNAHEDRLAARVAKELWRFEEERRREERTYRRLHAAADFREERRIEATHGYAAVKAACRAEDDLAKAVFALRKPLRANHEKRAAVALVGDKLIVALAGLGRGVPTEGEVMVIPIRAVAVAHADDNFDVPAWREEERAADGPEQGILGEHMRIPFRLPDGQALDVTIWAGLTKRWEALEKHGAFRPGDCVPWVYSERGPFTMAVTARTTFILEVQGDAPDALAEPDPPEPATIDPAR